MLKKILLGLGAVLAVFALGLVALSVFFDANKFKPELERYVRDHFRRTIRFDGDLALAFFPHIALALPQTTLSSLAGDRTSASLKSAEVSVALLPLLRGRIEVGAISIDGLSATVERRRDGTTSIDDLIRHSAKATQQGSVPAGTQDFEVGSIDLSDADLVFNDLETKRTLHLSKVALKTGRLARVGRTPLQLDMQFDLSAPQATGQLRLAATLDLDLGGPAYVATELDAALSANLDQRPIEVAVRADRAAYAAATGGIEAIKVDVQAKGKWGTLTIDESRMVAPALAFEPQDMHFAVGGLEASAKGSTNAGAFEATATAPKIEISEKTASGQRVVLTLNFAPASAHLPGGQARLALEGVTGSLQNIEITKVSLGASGSKGTRRFAAALSGALAASLEARTLSLPRFAGEVTVEDPALTESVVKVPLTAQLALDAKAERASAGFAARLDEADVAAEISLRGFSAPEITFEASAGRLNLDRYFPAAKVAPGGDGTGQKDDPRVDFSALRNLDLSGSIKVGSLQARGLRATNVDAGLRAANGRLEIAPLNALAYGGSVAASAYLQAEGNEVQAEAAFSNISIQPLMKDLFERNLLEGRGNLKLDLSASGATVGAMKTRLGGSAALELRDGAIHGVDLAAVMRNARAQLVTEPKDATTRANDAERTVFSELNATFAIKDGIAVNEDLKLEASLVRASGAGTVDIGESSMDYVASVRTLGTLKGLDGKPLDRLRGVTVPVRVSGPLDALAWTIDWNAVAQEMLQQAQAAQRPAPGATPSSRRRATP